MSAGVEKWYSIIIIFCIDSLICITALNAWAAPVVSDGIITDVTPRSFSIVWTSDIPATGNIEIFSNPDGLTPVDAVIENISSLFPPAEDSGVLKVRASGLQAETVYYYRTITDALYLSGSTIYPDIAPLPSVTTESLVVRTFIEETGEYPFGNSLLVFEVYHEDGQTPADGALVLLDVEGSDYPVSAFVGEGYSSPATIVDTNNLFDAADNMNLDLYGNEPAFLILVGGINGSTYYPFNLPADNGTCEVIQASLSSASLAFDSDDDGIPDGYGTTPCTGGNTTDCDDNCIDTTNPDQADMESDGVGDVCDNCEEVFNPDQRDTNSGEDDNLSIAGEQHYGNICDPDFDNDGIVSIFDFNEWRKYAGETVPTCPEDVDLNGDGFCWIQDFNIWRLYYGSPPGPGIGE